jgi:hypothetical protein
VASEPRTIRGREGASPYLAPAVMLLMLLAALGYRHLRSSPMDGIWLRETGAIMPDTVTGLPLIPNEIRTRLTHGQFATRYWGPVGGVEHITLQLDDREHLYQSVPGTEIKVTYRARMDGPEVVVTRRTFTPSNDMGSLTERWSVADGGRKLKVSVGKDEIVYGRPPLLRSLFRASP